ncbi:MAG: Re/Si-specific NAD(P)(+) transhydrogenase subunit alpha [Candidatus Solibacter usitatus]|nr:Re/Si-specific NAD(P)(+) transhydrogenase subunit alpha [Candidatus Solibacter usitatus]
MTVGVLKETAALERRVALTPKVADLVAKMGAQICMERGAGSDAGFADSDFEARGVQLCDSVQAVLEKANVIFSVRVPAPRGFSQQHTVIGFCDPLSYPQAAAAFAETGATLFSMEMVPRITRAQSMDALSSMASIAGYKAVILAAETMPRMFPLMMTAAGTIPAARVLVIGAGVAGLQAIATARRLGAIVMGYDVRAAVREQIESLGAKFLEIKIEGSGEGQGGYAKQLTEEQINSQRRQMAEALRHMDAVITTAAVPGRRAPILITKEMVQGMAAGSVIVDIAAERGGNCELTRPGETAVEFGVTILGPTNIAASVPYHASLMYSRNLATFLANLMKGSELTINISDEIIRDSLVARAGKVVHPAIQTLLGQEVSA